MNYSFTFIDFSITNFDFDQKKHFLGSVMVRVRFRAMLRVRLRLGLIYRKILGNCPSVDFSVILPCKIFN
jgi:hypothetical protein